jgi:hypothetical protein
LRLIARIVITIQQILRRKISDITVLIWTSGWIDGLFQVLCRQIAPIRVLCPRVLNSISTIWLAVRFGTCRADWRPGRLPVG